MTHRFQVLLEPEQLEMLRVESRRTGMSVGALIRGAVERVYGPPPPEERQRALARLLAMNLPTADWPEMEDEILRGYGR